MKPYFKEQLLGSIWIILQKYKIQFVLCKSQLLFSPVYSLPLILIDLLEIISISSPLEWVLFVS